MPCVLLAQPRNEYPLRVKVFFLRFPPVEGMSCELMLPVPPLAMNEMR
jgi:hypothetical protein